LAQVKAAAAMERMTTQQQGQELLIRAAVAVGEAREAATVEAVETVDQVW
jgi:hypothetical protein